MKWIKNMVLLGVKKKSNYVDCAIKEHVESLKLYLPPFLDTSPRQLFGTLGAHRLWQLNLQSVTVWGGKRRWEIHGKVRGGVGRWGAGTLRWACVVLLVDRLRPCTLPKHIKAVSISKLTALFTAWHPLYLRLTSYQHSNTTALYRLYYRARTDCTGH